MAESARRKSDNIILYASELNATEWNQIKDSYQVGDLVFEQCGCVAVPKTSITGTQFFSHHVDECKTAPESVWHHEAKKLIVRSAIEQGLQVTEELPGRNGASVWKSDVFIHANSGPIAIEIQRSHQTLERYLERQEKYQRAGIRCFWIVYREKYRSLIKALSYYRMEKQGMKLPFGPQIESLPAMWLDLDEGVTIRGPQMIAYSLNEWIASIVDNRFVYYPDGLWKISRLAEK